MSAEDTEVLVAAAAARAEGHAGVLATVVRAEGSTPRAAGAKMFVHADGRLVGTIGGGKFEALVRDEALAALASADSAPRLREYPLREGEPDSFGAICGGTVTVFIEPLGALERVVVCGGGHCGRAIAKLAAECGLHAVLFDDRAEFLVDPPRGVHPVSGVPVGEFLASLAPGPRDAVVAANRQPPLDRAVVAAALRLGPRPGYIGMIGSRRKVLRVWDELAGEGWERAEFTRVRAPMGLDVGGDSPVEIAVSVLAELLPTLRHTSGQPLGLDSRVASSRSP